MVRLEYRRYSGEGAGLLGTGQGEWRCWRDWRCAQKCFAKMDSGSPGSDGVNGSNGGGGLAVGAQTNGLWVLAVVLW